MAGSKSIDIIISAQDRASKEVRRVRSEIESLNRISSNLNDIGYAMTAMGAGIATGLGYAIKAAGDFEQAVVNLGSVMGRQYGQMQDLEQIARQFGRTTTHSATEAAQAMQLVASYGYEEANVLKDHTAVALKLATAQSYDLSMTTDILISTMKNFQKQGYTSARVADILVQASNKSSASMDKFRFSLKYVSPIANMLGMSLESMVAQMSMLYDAGLSAEQVGTSLRGIWESLLNPTKKAKDILKQYGLTLDEVNPKTNKMADILDRLKGMSAQDIFTIFGVEGAPAMTAMLDQGSKKLRELEQAYKNAGGALDRQYNTQLRTFNNQMKIAKNNLEDVAITIGKNLIPAIQWANQQLSQLVKWFQNLDPETQKWISYALAGSAALMVLAGGVFIVVGAFLKFISTMREFGLFLKGLSKLPSISAMLRGLGAVLGWLRSGFMMLGRAILMLGRFLFTTPIGAIIGAIITVLILLYEAWTNNWGGIQQKTQAVWNWLVSAFNSIVSSISQFVNQAITWFQNFDLMATLQSAWAGIVEWVSSIWQSIKDTVYNFLLGILMDTGQTQEQAKQTLQNAWNNILAFFQGFGQILYEVFLRPWIKIGEGIFKLLVNIVQGVINLWNWLVSITAPYVAAFITLVMAGMNLLSSTMQAGINAVVAWWTPKWNVIKTTVQLAWQLIKAVVQAGIAIAKSYIIAGLSVISAYWKAVWNAIKAVAKVVWSAIKSQIQSAINIIKNIIALAINIIAGNWRGAWQNIQNIAKNAMNIVKSLIKGDLNAIKSAWSAFKSTALSSGRAIMDAFANGIRSAIGKVAGAVKDVVAKARRYFGFSDAKEGPFSNITHSGYATMAAFAKGATQAKSLLARNIGGTLQSALSGGTAGAFGIRTVGSLAPAAETVGLSPAPQQPIINLTFNVYDNPDPKKFARTVMEEIQRHMRR